MGTQAKSFSRVRPDARGRCAGAAQGAGRGQAVSGAAGRGVSVRVVVVERVGAAARGRQSRRRSAGRFSRGGMHSPPQRPGQPCGASTPSLRKGVLDSGTWGNRPTPLPSPSSARDWDTRRHLPSKDVTGVRAGARGEQGDPAAPLLGPHHVHGLQQIVEARGGAESPRTVGDAVRLAGRALPGDSDALGCFAAGRGGSAARGARAGARGSGWARENHAAAGAVVAPGSPFLGQEAVALGGPREGRTRGAGGTLQQLRTRGSAWRHLYVFNVCRKKEEVVTNSVFESGSLAKLRGGYAALFFLLLILAPACIPCRAAGPRGGPPGSAGSPPPIAQHWPLLRPSEG